MDTFLEGMHDADVKCHAPRCTAEVNPGRRRSDGHPRRSSDGHYGSSPRWLTHHRNGSLKGWKKRKGVKEERASRRKDCAKEGRKNG